MLILLLAVLFVARPAGGQSQADLDYGPHAVGLRTFADTDRSRMVRAGATFDGQPIAGDRAMPMEIAVWYPAAPAATASRMTTAAYRALGPQGERERAAVIADWRATLGFGGLTATDEDLARALDQTRKATRDAAPLPGRFPVILSGLGRPSNSSVLGEYLASHGYVVVTAATLARTATQQASQPPIALETQTRNLEYLLGWSERLPYADTGRLAIAGVNFDGMAGLIFQMRNMRADAIVSVDGWEGKVNGTALMRESSYFDPVRMRVPYLVFEQDEPSIGGTLAHDRGTWNALKYSDRQWYVLHGMNHLLLTSDQFTVPSLSEPARAGYRFLYGSIRQFLDTHVRKAPGADPVAAPGVVKVTDHAAALRSAPTGEEFESLVMNGPIDRAAAVFRVARRLNPDAAIADESTLNLYAFRFTQQKKRPELLVIRSLAAEAFPSSATAAYNLGVATEESGDAGRARAELTRVLSLLDRDTGLSAPAKERLRTDTRARLERLRK